MGLHGLIPSDDQRKAESGTDMAFKAVVMDIQGDWAVPMVGWVGQWTTRCASCEIWTVNPNSAAHRDILLFLTFNIKCERAVYATWAPATGLACK